MSPIVDGGGLKSTQRVKGSYPVRSSFLCSRRDRSSVTCPNLG